MSKRVITLTVAAVVAASIASHMSVASATPIGDALAIKDGAEIVRVNVADQE